MKIIQKVTLDCMKIIRIGDTMDNQCTVLTWQKEKICIDGKNIKTNYFEKQTKRKKRW